MKIQLFYRTIFILQLIFTVGTSFRKRILVNDNFYTLVNKLNALEKEVATLKANAASNEVAALKANTASNYTLQALKQNVTWLETQQAKQANTVAFMAYLTSHEHGKNHHIYFDDVKTNIGNAYNPIHGMFVAPFDGLYQFSVTACSYTGHYIVLELTANNTNLGKIIAGDDAYSECNSKAFVSKLAKGDSVFVQHKTTGEWLFSDASFGLPSFSGFLIKAL